MNLSSEPTTLYRIMPRLSNVLKWSLAIVMALRKGPHIGLASPPWVCMMTSMAASQRLRGSIQGRRSSRSREKPFFCPCAWMIISQHMPAFAGTLNAAFWTSGSETMYRTLDGRLPCLGTNLTGRERHTGDCGGYDHEDLISGTRE